MNCLLVMKIKWSLDINTGVVERSEAARARSLAGATVGVPYEARFPNVITTVQCSICSLVNNKPRVYSGHTCSIIK